MGELEQHPNWVILRTFSKAFRLAAHRVGYAIANRELITAIEKIRLPYNLPSFSIAAALVALNHRQLILPLVAEILKERDRVFNALSQISCLKISPSAANFVYIRLATGDPSQLTETLKNRGTLIRHTGGGLRITIGSTEENTRTIERLKSLLQ